jgi:hypothetical protein
VDPDKLPPPPFGPDADASPAAPSATPAWNEQLPAFATRGTAPRITGELDRQERLREEPAAFDAADAYGSALAVLELYVRSALERERAAKALRRIFENRHGMPRS